MRAVVRQAVPWLSCQEAFGVAADVESYPRFLPWCVAARVIECDGDRLRVDNVFGLGPVRARFETRARLEPPHGIVITSTAFPFERLRIAWRFETRAAGGCDVSCAMEQSFRLPVLDGLARRAAEGLEARILARFLARAAAVYGRPG